MEFLPKICILKLDIRPNYRPNIRPFLAEYSVSADTSFTRIGRSLTTNHRSEKSWKQFFSILSICLVEVAFTKFLWKNVRVNFHLGPHCTKFREINWFEFNEVNRFHEKFSCESKIKICVDLTLYFFREIRSRCHLWMSC